MSEIVNKVEKAKSLAEATVAALSEVTEQESGAPDKIVPITILVTPEDRKRLRQLSLDSETSLQKLGHEAWNRYLQWKGLDPLTPVTANVPSGLRR